MDKRSYVAVFLVGKDQCIDVVNNKPASRTKTLTPTALSATMTTIPARLARTTRISSSPSEARSRTIQLYRDWYRSVSFPPLPAHHIPLAHHTLIFTRLPKSSLYTACRSHHRSSDSASVKNLSETATSMMSVSLTVLYSNGGRSTKRR